jgi:hypothetical protein
MTLFAGGYVFFAFPHAQGGVVLADIKVRAAGIVAGIGASALNRKGAEGRLEFNREVADAGDDGAMMKWDVGHPG